MAFQSWNSFDSWETLNDDGEPLPYGGHARGGRSGHGSGGGVFAAVDVHYLSSGGARAAIVVTGPNRTIRHDDSAPRCPGG